MRRGPAGKWDKFVGQGQAAAEFWLTLVPALLTWVATPLYALIVGLGWVAIQQMIARWRIHMSIPSRTDWFR
jgi:hypothetical protein